jgi:ABC-2 type transport system permease protein/lipopolysaccharide transport system permease protein
MSSDQVLGPTPAEIRRSRHYYASGRSRSAAAFVDVRDGARLWRTWLYLAWMDVMRSKRRAWLGALWYPLALGVTVWVVGPLFGMMRGYALDLYVPYFALGTVCYQIATQFLMGSGKAFIGASGQISNSSLPYSFFLFRFAAQQVILSALYLPVVVSPFLVLGVAAPPNLLGAIVGLAAYFAVVIALSFPLAIIFTRFRDITQLLRASTRFIFLVTPIIWMVDDLEANPEQPLSGRNLIRSMFVDANPFYHLIELVRAPALGDSVSGLTVLYAAAMFALGVVGFFTIFIMFRRRIVYWL